MSWSIFFSGVLIGLSLLSAAFSLILSARNIERRINLSYAAVAVLLSVAMAFDLFAVTSSSVDAILLYDRFATSFFLCGAIASVFMIAALTGFQSRPVLLGLTAGLLVLLVVNWILPVGLVHGTLSDSDPQILMDGGMFSRFASETGYGSVIPVVSISVLLAFGIRAALHQRKSGNRADARLLLLLITIGIVGILVEFVLLIGSGIATDVIPAVGCLGCIVLVTRRNLAALSGASPSVHERAHRRHQPVAAGPAVSEVHRSIGIQSDRVEQRRAEEQNLLLARTLKSVRDCISITDSDDRIIFVNDAFLNTYGYHEGDILGKHVSVLRSPNAPPEETQGIFPSTREGGWHGEVLNRRKDGSEFPVELWTSVVRDGTGEPMAYVGVARDISERKFAEKAIIAEKERAERSERLKDAFIANISHEVRTPLNIILGYTGLIGEMLKTRSTEEEQGYFDSVQRGAQRLQRTVDMILSISRLQVGDILIEAKALELPGLLAHTLEDYRTAARQKGLTLSFVNDAPEAIVTADEYCILQTVQNLLDNAIKYTERGRVTLRLWQDAEARICISIADTGIGISEDYLPLIFEPYTQEEIGYSRSYDGIGLGLSLVKRYVELIGAALHIESAKNRGTTVTIEFPRPGMATSPHSSVVHDPAKETERRDAAENTPQAELPTVLLVEDEVLTVEYMIMLLRRHAHVISAVSGKEAWDILETVKVDLILMDISLSGDMSGLELTRKIRRTPSLAAMPVVAVTAHAFAHDRTRCLEAGCDAYLLKPVEQRTLLETMQHLLEDGNRTDEYEARGRLS
ncbi:MAG: response regulator [Bacteroidetes bacterium]|nr:response regulator [Bacteroidota bacterium]